LIAAFGIYCRRNPAHDYEAQASLAATEVTSTTASPLQGKI